MFAIFVVCKFYGSLKTMNMITNGVFEVSGIKSVLMVVALRNISLNRMLVWVFLLVISTVQCGIPKTDDLMGISRVILQDADTLDDLQCLTGLNVERRDKCKKFRMLTKSNRNHLLKIVKLEALKDILYIGTIYFQWPRIRKKRSRRMDREKDRERFTFNDPMWKHQWYMNGESPIGHLMDIEGAWRSGVTGKGVKIAIVDDGIEYTHPEILANYDPKISYDFNENDDDPFPRFTHDHVNAHGTRCAGQIVARANNSLCCVGIALNAKVGGLRILDGEMTDLSESEALSYRTDYTDIFSSSWGPTDNGEKVDGPGLMTISAMTRAVQEGRRGLGTIYVWAAGNGGRHDDDCNCDGYTNSPLSITVNSVTESFKVPPYSESCSAALTVAFSGGNFFSDRNIITSDLGHECTNTHSGTSASVPIVAACVALALEANPNLTWRDVQHLIVHSSFRGPLESKNWRTNGAGYEFDDFFGFGLLNVNQLVLTAQNWTHVPERHSCAVLAVVDNVRIPANRSVVGQMPTMSCNAINSLEHVESVFTIDSNRRGGLSISLTSPMGTISNLLRKRVRDMSVSGFYQWPFMSVQFWGENPSGVWTVEIHNGDTKDAFFTQWLAVFHGYRTNT